MAESFCSFVDPLSKPVVVRVKRKPFQSPLDAFWLEINDRPLKRPLSDFENLSISDSSQIAKDASFEQIWKSWKVNKGTTNENALQEICQLYDIVCVDSEEKTNEVQPEYISLEDQRFLSCFLPLLRDVIPNVAAEVEADISSQSKQEDYVYDLYIVTDAMIAEENSSHSYRIVQVDDEDYYDGPDNSDYETDDSNAEKIP